MVKCNRCNRQFANQESLKQHTTAAHGTGASKVAAKAVKAGKGINSITTAPLNRVSVLGATNAASTNLRRQELLTYGALGNTQLGSTWALRALHPCDEAVVGGAALPDHLSDATATPELRYMTTISAPSWANGKPWDVCIIVSPLPEYAGWYFHKTADQEWHPEGQSGKVNMMRFPALSSSEMEDVATAWRSTFIGMTCHLNSSSTTNQGMVYASQFACEYESIWSENDRATKGVLMKPGDITPDALFQRSPKTCAWNAKTGVYMPIYPSQPTHRMHSTAPQPTGTYIPDGTEKLQAGSAIRWFNGTSASSAQQSVAIDGFNWNMGVIHFTGLDAKASVSVKAKHGLEFIPKPGTLMACFSRSSPPIDTKALESLTSVAQVSQAAYPAHYNDLGSILSSIGKILSPVTGVVSSIGRGLGKLGIPVVSDIASTVADVSDTVHDIAAGGKAFFS
ncbi:capsid protein [Beihai horseshoe crab virus 1]|uniref:capsid protein n=1 Tax=Beihai horseshoe crab virus 1 TaxID=1922392 RepID=UPI00090B0274|nr:capsid protein [Beihai horseshoe crab virus 1]APG76292.1 capsid protein [Beihai horseshoe crab virus 1]